MTPALVYTGEPKEEFSVHPPKTFCNLKEFRIMATHRFADLLQDLSIACFLTKELTDSLHKNILDAFEMNDLLRKARYGSGYGEQFDPTKLPGVRLQLDGLDFLLIRDLKTPELYDVQMTPHSERARMILTAIANYTGSVTKISSDSRTEIEARRVEAQARADTARESRELERERLRLMREANAIAAAKEAKKNHANGMAVFLVLTIILALIGAVTGMSMPGRVHYSINHHR